MHLWIECMVIRESRPQRSVDSSPGLIAVFHALHRLLAPRHPPHALSSLAAFLPTAVAGASYRPASPATRETGRELIQLSLRAQTVSHGELRPGRATARRCSCEATLSTTRLSKNKLLE